MSATPSVVGHILVTPMEEISRKPHGEVRWCFQCRKHHPFELVVIAPIVTSIHDTGAWYGPTAEVKCTSCGLTDGDLFPGRYREWGDE